VAGHCDAAVASASSAARTVSPASARFKNAARATLAASAGTCGHGLGCIDMTNPILRPERRRTTTTTAQRSCPAISQQSPLKKWSLRKPRGGSVAGHLVPAGSMFAFLAAHRAEVFADADYADLFAPPGFGRPSIPATQMAAVLTLQALHDYSDREAAEAVRFDVRWKVAIGAPLDDPGVRPVIAGVLAAADREVGASAPGQ
jgi:hypothetical protein